ncbi:MAG: ArsR family transcriptional regulator, partial [Gammaproteobacteria bacterium]
MTDDKLLSVFTPSRTPPEDLEAIHVQRHALLDDAVSRVRESASSANKHHLLFVGPRGTGKTHFITLLVHRLGQIDELDNSLRIAWLNEDETSTSLLELLQRIFLALCKRYPAEFAENQLEPMFDLEAAQAEPWLIDHLLQALAHRTLLVVVENLDALFSGLGKAGQQRLRAFIQEHPVLSLVATAQRLTEDLTLRKNAFFGFFQTETLKTLSAPEAAALLGNIARLKQQEEVSLFLNGATGKARIRALHHLAGGNHRIFIVLSQFITRDNIDSLVVPFTKMVDEMTPYYQERIRWLPAQQRKIVEFLCGRERPTPVKQIARRLFATQQTISSQLKDLRGKGYVIAEQRGRESLYQIAEPLMRICVEIKENQTHAPLRILVDFLRVWYDGPELDRRLRGCKGKGLESRYLESAIELNREQDNLRARLLIEGYRAEIDAPASIDWEKRMRDYADKSEALALAFGEWNRGEPETALQLIDDELAKGDRLDIREWSSALLLEAEIHFRNDAPLDVIDALSALINLKGIPIDLLATALRNRGVTFEKQGKIDKAIRDYSRVIDLDGSPVDLIAMALNYRGITFGQQGEIEKAIGDFSRVIDLDGAPVDQIAKALNYRGITFGQQGEIEKA